MQQDNAYRVEVRIRLKNMHAALLRDSCISNLQILCSYGLDMIKEQVNTAMQSASPIIPKSIDLDPSYSYPDSLSLTKWLSQSGVDINLIKNREPRGYYVDLPNFDYETAFKKQIEALLIELFSEHVDSLEFIPINNSFYIARLPRLNLFANSKSVDFSINAAITLDKGTNHFEFVLFDDYKCLEITDILLKEGSIDDTVWRRYNPSIRTKNAAPFLTEYIRRVNNIWIKQFGVPLAKKVEGDQSFKQDCINYALLSERSPRTRILLQWYNNHVWLLDRLLDTVKDSYLYETSRSESKCSCCRS